MNYYYTPYFTDRKGLTSRDFIQMLADILTKAPYQDVSNSLPFEIRVKRVQSLAKAFQLDENLGDLLDGSFLDDSTPEFISTAVKKMEEFFPGEVNKKIFKNKTLVGFSLSTSFGELLELLSHMHATLESFEVHPYNDIFLERTRIIMVEAKETIGPLAHRINEFLGFLVDPLEREISFDELRLKWNWPNDNLAEIDAEWH